MGELLAQIAALVMLGTSAVALWFFRLWQGAKEREALQRRVAEQQNALRQAERAAREKQDEERRETERQAHNTAQEARDGRTDHFESAR